MHFYDEDAGSRLMGIYSRAVGGIQVLYALCIGRFAFLFLEWIVQRMSRIAQNGFSFEGEFLKDKYVPAIDVGNLGEGTILVLLSLSAFIGGCGLLGRRPWARRWEIPYLIFASVYAVGVFTVETRRGHDLGYIVLAYLVFALPYLPFLFISAPPYKVPIVGDVTKTKLVVDDLDGI
jgi:hypothetical protein